jgi:hypothetical protein
MIYAAVLTCTQWAIAWLRQLVASLSPWRPRFVPVSVHVGFVVEKVTLGQDFHRDLQFSFDSTMAVHSHILSGG